MNYLDIEQVRQENKQDLQPVIEQALDQLALAQQQYPGLIMEVVKTGKLEQQLDRTYQELDADLLSNPDGSLAAASGAYFLNEDVFGGSRETDTLNYLNPIGKNKVSDWQAMPTKLKLGPGVGYVQAPPIYKDLLCLGLDTPPLTVNYTAPFGNTETRNGIKALMDSRIDPEKQFFPDNGVFLTEGATEGVDLFMEGIARTKPGSRVVFLGLSYYTGPFSALQKGLNIERLIANPVQAEEKTKFIPGAQEISQSLPSDTSALLLTAPNNPNGETYDDDQLKEIMKLAKQKDILILFDCLFENMFFDRSQNYQSRLLQIAQAEGALDKVVVVDGLSKTKNFAGERIGFLATTNTEFASTLTNIVLARRCNPRLTVGPLVLFEGLARKVKTLTSESLQVPLATIIDYVLKDQKNPFDRTEFKKMYLKWDDWNDQTLRFYEDNLRLTRALLDGSITASSPDNAAFNTFVQMSDLEPGTNNMDFLAKLMFTLGTYTQIGPCFGISQNFWDNHLGVWPRITYACDRKDLVEALTRLITFSKFYAEKNFGDPNKFPTLQISFDRQI